MTEGAKYDTETEINKSRFFFRKIKLIKQSWEEIYKLAEFEVELIIKILRKKWGKKWQLPIVGQINTEY